VIGCAIGTLQGNSVASGLWTVVSGTGNVSNPTLPTSLVSGLVAGQSVTLRWTSSGATCPSSSDDVVIARVAVPTLDLSGTQTLYGCAQANVSLVAGAFGVGFNVGWSKVNGSGTLVSPTNTSTVLVTGLTAGATGTFRWTQATPDTCVSKTADVTISIGVAANAGPDLDIGCGTSATLSPSAVVSGTGNWTIVLGGLNIIFNGVANVTNVPIGATTLRWSITGASPNCTDTSDDMIITKRANLVAVNAGVDQAGKYFSLCVICILSFVLTGCGSFNLNASSLEAGTLGSWTFVGGEGSFSNSSSPTSMFVAVSAGNFTLTWTVSAPNCASQSDSLLISASAAVSAAYAGPNQFIGCLQSTAMAAAPPAFGVGSWSLVSGNATISNASDATSSVTLAASESSATFRWTVSLSGCNSTISDMIVTRLANGVDSAIANPSLDVDVGCVSSFALKANTVGANQVGTWTSSYSNATFLNATDPMTIVSSLPPFNTTANWTITAPNCASSVSTLSLHRYSAVNASLASGQSAFLGCSTSAVLDAVPVVDGTGLWSLQSGSATIANPTNPKSTVSSVVSGAVLRWTVTGPSCTPSFVDYTLSGINGLIAQAGPDQHIACLTTATLAATGPSNGATGVWSVVNGAATFANTTSPNSTVTMSGASVKLRWTVSLVSCQTVFDDVIIERYPNGVSAPVLSPIFQDIGCATSTMLGGQSPTIGTGVWSLDSGIATVVDSASPNTLITSISGSGAVLRWTISLATCTSKSATTTIKRYDSVSVAQFEHPDTLHVGCQTSIVLSATVPVNGFGHWSKVNGTAFVWNPDRATTTVTSLADRVSYIRYVVSAPQCVSSERIMIVTQADIKGTECGVCTLVQFNGGNDVVSTW
jgi:hypothetical protein